MDIRDHVPLAPLTTMQVGGAARYFAEAQTEDNVREALIFSRDRRVPIFVLGGGSNLVVADTGWPGLVLKISIGGVSRNASLFEAGAGVNWDDFVANTVLENCSGVECLSGIPGSVGGTPVQNVGAYGQEVSQTIESVRVFDIKQDRILDLSREACRFEYRASIFNATERGRYIILRASFRLLPGGAPNLHYADLKNYFSSSQRSPTLSDVREGVRQIRRRKGMLIVPGDPDSRSAGSFFKNPVLSAAEFRELARRAQSRGLQIPTYPALAAQHKISAAWLVENSGFAKGFTMGAARISQKHALALTNTGHATAAEIVRLKEHIQAGVADVWGIVLEPEPVFLGFDTVSR